MEALALLEHPSTFSRSDETFNGLKGYLESQEVLRMEHGELERMLAQKGADLIRQLLQDHVDLRGPGKAIEEVRDQDDTPRPQARLQSRQLETLFGTVYVDRLGYGAPGMESLHPKDAALNLTPDHYSMGVRRRVAEEAARGSFEEAVEQIQRTTAAHVPKRQAEELAIRAAVDFEAFYQERRQTALVREPAGKILVISFDGKGVAMRKEDLREATRKAAEESQHKLQKRLSKGEKRNFKRMATVGTIYTVGHFPRKPEDIIQGLAGNETLRPGADRLQRPRPESKRVMASLERTPEEVIAEIFDEAEHRDPKKTRKWVALVDGNPSQILQIVREARRRKLKVPLIIDFIHVTEYVWRAGTAFHESGTKELEAWVQGHLLEILRGKSSLVAAGMRRSATRRGLAPKEREQVDKCANYLTKLRRHLDYQYYLQDGLPIATGVIEGACRHLVKDRMEVTGARWSLTGAEAILRLRALKSSGDFDEYWLYHERQEKRRNHEVRYKDGVIPEVVLPKPARPRFRVVK
jgi:hypothetical protein